jgi:hypothetical protein
MRGTTMRQAVVVIVAAGMAACGGAAPTGSLKFDISGEDAAVSGFPVDDEGEVIALADGWTIVYSKVLIGVGNLSVKGADGVVGYESAARYVVDLHRGPAELATVEALEARRWEKVSFEILAPNAGATAGAGVAAADVERMVANGFNYWIEGTATKDARTVTFAWGFRNATRNTDCTDGADGKAGVVVSQNSSTRAEFTVHLEHMFWTSLGSEQAELRFDPMAAKADPEGHVTFEALATQSLDAPKDAEGKPIPSASGAGALAYDAQSDATDPKNLQEFVLAATATMAHLNGGGLCTITRLP